MNYLTCLMPLVLATILELRPSAHQSSSKLEAVASPFNYWPLGETTDRSDTPLASIFTDSPVHHIDYTSWKSLCSSRYWVLVFGIAKHNLSLRWLLTFCTRYSEDVL
ncbi:hypothetical protein CPB83DRAFT_863691 [Crepidotus variabilis]|uniref:Uncharacterized protein n=1 Tax=Crepidotus variabilis TaxID=179855 RepID=A0A9P6JJL0_9AGAR|nr:hypothetical protein CPB83DRAFT_863691 [Crepidotus variabilis]